MKTVTRTLGLIVGLAAIHAVALPAEPAGKDYKQAVAVDPAYKDSAEKRYREQRKAQAEVLRDQILKAQALRLHQRRLAPARPARVKVGKLPGFPLWNTLLLTGVGAVIGNQSHHAWEGAAAGAVVGGMLDTYLHQKRNRTPD